MIEYSLRGAVTLRPRIRSFAARAAAALLLGLSTLALLPAVSQGCACGCGVFDVSTSSMLPTQEGGMMFAEFDYMDQNRNYSGTHRAPAANNDDKEIRTQFYTVGAEYMFNRAWGVSAEVPFWNRTFKTTDGVTGAPVSFTHAALGDIRIKGVYTGFSPDMSTGVTFGLKLPNGDYKYANFDPDTSIGTGSTDVLLGAFHTETISSDGKWKWYSNAELDLPVLHVSGYRPGSEVDGATGVYYHGIKAGTSMVIPLMQVVGSYRLRDGGPDSNPTSSGYERILLTPGVEIHHGDYHVYMDVGFPVYQSVNGNQLVAAEIYKLNISRSF